VKINPVPSELLHAYRHTKRRTNGEMETERERERERGGRNMTELIVSFCSFMNMLAEATNW
jgi:hypothetical protein